MIEFENVWNKLEVRLDTYISPKLRSNHIHLNKIYNSLQDLIEEADADLATELDALLATAVTDVDATLDPFDLAIVDGESSVEGAKVQTAVQALVAFGDKLLEAKVALGIN